MTKQDWKDRANWLKGELDNGCFTSAQEYHLTLAEYRLALAKSLGTTETKLNPMGFWFGHQSN